MPVRVTVSDLEELSKLPQSVLTLLNKGVCNSLYVQLVGILFVNAHQHHMVKPGLAHDGCFVENFSADSWLNSCAH